MLAGVIAEELLMSVGLPVGTLTETETANAGDAISGSMLFSVLLDEPAAVTEIIAAFSGLVLSEAASGADVIAIHSTTDVAIDDPAHADSVQDTTANYTGIAVAEAAAADSSQDATAVPLVAPVRMISASRAGLGSVVVRDDSSGKTRILTQIGTVS